MTDLHQSLSEAFGFDEFRPLQHEAVEAAVQGRDVLVVMPTGAGKSLCFQLPALSSAGVTLVVSPLIALMRDQVAALEARPAFAARGVASIHSGLSAAETREVLRQLRAGELALLYVAPERFRSGAFMDALQDAQIARFVVDEAHCISEWGHDFRPDYLVLHEAVEKLGHPPLMAVTATATRRVQESIVNNLRMRDPERFIGGFDRPNLHFASVRCKGDREKRERLSKALPKLAARFDSGVGCGLIYVATRRQCEEVAELCAEVLRPLGIRTGAYHAGMDSSDRNSVQEQWQRGDIRVLVATNAFGMGVDKPDVRFVVHFIPPDSPENYYQEAGRAGRDGRRSRCVVLYAIGDRRTREWFIDNDTLEASDLAQLSGEIIKRTEEDGIARLPRGWNGQLEWSDVKSRLALGELLRRGVCERVSDNAEEISVRMVQKGISPQVLREMTADLAHTKSERQRRLTEMFAFCKTRQCRRVALLDYFGDKSQPRETFCCDNCDNPPSAAASVPADVPEGYVAAPSAVDDVYSLLQAMDALRPRVGKAKLIKVLRASSSKDVERFKDASAWGALRLASQGQVDSFMDDLIARGWLHQADEEEYYVVSVTRAGREVWSNREPVDIAVPGARRAPAKVAVGAGVAAGSAPDDEDAEDELFESLRDWRRERASELNLPPYVVFSDTTLRSIARQRPDVESDLRLISGVGEIKMQKYGAEVLRVVRENA